MLGTIVGTRPELRLRDRWWHRLVLVAYVVLTALIALATVVIRGSVPVRGLSEHELKVVSDLLSFTESFEGTGNPAVAFWASDGSLGTALKTDPGTKDALLLDFELAFIRDQFVCKRGGRVFGATGASLEIVKTERNGEQIEPLPNRSGENADTLKSLCWGPSSLSNLPAASITKVRPTTAVVAVRWVRNAVAGVVAAGAFAFLLSLVYYRVLIYIVFGARTSAA